MQTKEEIKQEILRCGRDPAYFIKNYVKIRHPVRGLIPFSLFDYQENLLDNYQKHRFNIILKARQLGISEVTAAYAAWLILFYREKNVLVLATKAETAKNIVKKVSTALKKLPSWLMLSKITTDNKLSIELANGSQIKAVASSDDAGRSEAVSLLIIDEAAFIHAFDDLWTGLLPTVQAGGKAIVLSTPNGVGNMYHTMYSGAETGENDFYPTRLMWWLHPERSHGLIDDPDRPGFKTSPWFVEETANMPARDIAQELECFRAGTKVVTPNGYELIENIKNGDLVLSHTGQFRKVLKTFKKNVSSNEIVKVELPMSRKNNLYVTKNHPILTENGWKSFGEDSSHSTLRAFFPKLSNESFLNELTEFDLSTFDSCEEFDDDTCRYNKQKGKTKRHIKIDYNLGRVIGLYLSEGYGKSRDITFAFHKDEKNLIEFLSNWSNEHGISFSVQERTYSKCNTFHMSSFFLREIISKFVSGKDCYTKLLTNDIYKCSKEFVKGIIDGIWEGDGYHNPIKKNVLRLANQKLIYQIRLLMSSFGLFTRVSYDVDEGCEPRSWYLELNNVDGKNISECTSQGFLEKKQSRCLFKDNLWWGRPNVYQYEDVGNVDVFNIEVEIDNSYVCENLVVHNCNFNASGDTVITAPQMKDISEGLMDPIDRRWWDRNLFVWWQFDKTKRYFITSDVARGDGKDFSTAMVWDIKTMEQQAEYCGKIPPQEFAKLLYDLGHEYGSAPIVIENNNVGIAVLEHLRLLEYESLYYSTKGDIRSGQLINTKWGSVDENLVPGFNTSQKTRPLLVDKFEEFIRNKTMIIRSKRLLEEIKTFIWNNGRPEAMKGRNDDLIIAAALGVWMKDTYFAPGQSGVDSTKKLIDSISKVETNITQIDGATKDPRLVPAAAMKPFGQQKQNPTEIKLPNGSRIDVRWLYR